MARVRRRVRFQINTIDHGWPRDAEGQRCEIIRVMAAHWARGNENRKEGREKKELILAGRKKQRSSGSQGGETGCTQNVWEAWRTGGMKRKRDPLNESLNVTLLQLKSPLNTVSAKKSFGWKNVASVNDATIMQKRVTTFLVGADAEEAAYTDRITDAIKCKRELIQPTYVAIF